MSSRFQKMVRLSLLLVAVSSMACKGIDPPPIDPPAPKPSPIVEAQQTIDALYTTSATEPTPERKASLAKIQAYADKAPASYFKNYLKSLDPASQSMEQNDQILLIYRKAFDRILEQVKQIKVASGKTVVWYLYNMGYVVKTPSVCFGIDLTHRWAEQLAPYLDFMCITHNHADHYSTPLIQTMTAAAKPVLSNYLASNTFTSKIAKSYTFGSVTIKTAMTDHNTTLKNFVTIYRIDCGADAGNLTILHCGDSNYTPAQYSLVQGPIDLLVARYAPNALTENNILSTGNGMVVPRVLFLSHLLELAHDGIGESRWTVEMGLTRAAQLNCDRSYMPFWGEQFTFHNRTL